MRLFDMDSREDYLLDGKYKVATPYAPLINVVEVVRCKECKHWKEWENGSGHCGRSENPHFWFGSDADDFCSFGERRKP